MPPGVQKAIAEADGLNRAADIIEDVLGIRATAEHVDERGCGLRQSVSSQGCKNNRPLTPF